MDRVIKNRKVSNIYLGKTQDHINEENKYKLLTTTITQGQIVLFLGK